MDWYYYVIYVFMFVCYLLEIEECLMVCLFVFVLYVDEWLEFGKGLSNEEELDLWCKSYVDEIEFIVEFG